VPRIPSADPGLRAAYQFKGEARLDGDDLLVTVDEIYSTKPGPEAGLRLDVMQNRPAPVSGAGLRISW